MDHQPAKTLDNEKQETEHHFIYPDLSIPPSSTHNVYTIMHATYTRSGLHLNTVKQYSMYLEFLKCQKRLKL
jgi:hypothetical protein